MRHSAKRFLSMILSLAMLLSAFIIFASFTRPAYESVQKTRNEKYTFDLELKNKKKAIEDVINLIKEHQSDSDFAENISIVFPTSTELSSALAQVHGLAVDINKLALVSIGVSESGGASRSSGGKKADTTTLEKPIRTLSFDLNLVGSYGNFKQFIKMVENNIRLFDVESISLNPASTGSKVPIDLYNYQIKLTTYFQSAD